MKKTLTCLLACIVVCVVVSLARAAGNPQNVTVRVTITSSLEITVVSGSLIDFGSMAPGAAASVLSSSTTIQNTGSGVNQTYKMFADSPSGWTAGASAANNTYLLQAAFHGSQPTSGNFGAEDTLGEDVGNEITADGSILTIDGSSTGLSVPFNGQRSIWYNFQPPTTSSETGVLDITVTITAQEG